MLPAERMGPTFADFATACNGLKFSQREILLSTERIIPDILRYRTRRTVIPVITVRLEKR